MASTQEDRLLGMQWGALGFISAASFVSILLPPFLSCHADSSIYLFWARLRPHPPRLCLFWGFGIPSTSSRWVRKVFPPPG